MKKTPSTLPDDIETLKKFSLGPCGGKFAVAADLDRTTMKAYQATMFFSSAMASRISYVVTPDQKIYFTHVQTIILFKAFS